ncbi:amidohydrolase 2 [Rhizorhabdus wittichii RW1]|uniref:Amidohydrolase 2 n=1 Tax=Rhizorhabdus wittichii (strain DSM 6014 / CCUG 31198 / JCM 15750 / NBRC 105917 / EY 4224 / RW1) TaxID=392499 RepID=A0A9J9LCN5_RHIWR|nr:amidohydrolase family protein [Rhizorhabdus wittichii]ABQ68672.1 amidohydrolase 2 [Rhizorhabdus wittichii RW1]
MMSCPRCRMARRSFLKAAAGGAAAALAAGLPGSALLAAGGTAGAIDFHTHMIDPDLPNLITGQMVSTDLAAWMQGFASPDVHVAHMDKYGVQAHVVGHSNATQGISWGDARHDLGVHQRVNDRIAREWVKAHPGRFHGAFGLPTQDLKLAIPELERAVTQLGMKVLQLSSQSPDGAYFGDPRFDPLWEAVQHFGVTVFIHPHGQGKEPPLDGFALANSVGQGVEEVKVMTSIIYNGVFDKFPRAKIVIAHGGGFLPHYYGRLDRNAHERPDTSRNISKLPSAYLKDFYYDSCVYGPEILAALIRVVGVDRIVLGSDFPVGEADGLSALRATPNLSAADVTRIARTTPAALLGL